MEINKICVICNKDNSNYKCPKCKEKYCSVNCFKTHKIDCENKISLGSEFNLNMAKEHQIEVDPNYAINCTRGLNLDEYQDIIVEKANLENLKSNKSIMNKVKNKKLQKIIKTIDSAKYKKRTLEKMLNDSDFKSFTDEILISLGYLKNNVFDSK